MGELEPYLIEYSKQKEYQILFRSASPQDSSYQNPDLYSSDRTPRKRRRSYSSERLPRQTCHCPTCRRLGGVSTSPAAGMQVANFRSPDRASRKGRRSYSPERMPHQSCPCPTCRRLGDASIKAGKKTMKKSK
jgi:hypothetical protein